MTLLLLSYLAFFVLSIILYFVGVALIKKKKVVLFFSVILFITLSGTMTYFLLNLEDKPAKGSRIITQEEIESW